MKINLESHITRDEGMGDLPVGTTVVSDGYLFIVVDSDDMCVELSNGCIHDCSVVEQDGYRVVECEVNVL